MTQMAQARNIRMQQYLDDWLIWARDKDTCFQDIQTLLALCQELGGEPQEIRTGAQIDFQFCRLPVRLDPRSSQTHPERWEAPKSIPFWRGPVVW